MATKEKPKTIVAFVIDISGSMKKTWQQAVDGFNEHLSKWKKFAKEGNEVLGCVVLFNGEVLVCKWLVPIEEIGEANVNDIKPDGSTAMRDAEGFTISELRNTTDQKEENTAWLMIVISDGGTNDDQIFKLGDPRLANMIAACEETKKWTFTYLLHSSQYAKEIAEDHGISVSNMAVWDNKSVAATSKALRCASARMDKYMGERKMGITASCNFMSDTLDAVADYSDASTDEVKEIAVGSVAKAAPKVVGEVPTFVWNFGDHNESVKVTASTANGTFSSARAVSLRVV